MYCTGSVPHTLTVYQGIDQSATLTKAQAEWPEMSMKAADIMIPTPSV